MRRHWSKRLFAALLAVWFVGARVEHAVGACGPYMAMPGMAHHEAPSSHHGTDDGGVASDCLSCCCAPIAQAPLPAPVTLATIALVPSAPAWSAAPEQAPAARANFFLPFATAPPAVMSLI